MNDSTNKINAVCRTLEKLDVSFKLHEHPAVYTVEEADKLAGDLPGGKSKNLFLRNKKGDQHYLAVVESHRKVDLNQLAQTLEASKLSFASRERLKRYLNLDPGAVSPFGLINDLERHVILILDNNLLKHAVLCFHPNVNTASLELSSDDLLKFVKSNKNPLIQMDF